MEKRVWIYCRVSGFGEKALLDFQEKILSDLAIKMDFKIVGITKELSSGKRLDSFKAQAMLNSIHRNHVDAVLTVTPKRICIFDDIFEEFEMLCNMHDVSVLSLKDEVYPLKQLLEAIL